MAIKNELLYTLIAIVLLLLIDIIVLPENEIKTDVFTLSAKETVAKRTRYFNYFIITNESKRYEVDFQTYTNLNPDSNIIIKTGSIIGIPKTISYLKNGQTATTRLGQFSRYVDQILLANLIGLLIGLVLNLKQPEKVKAIFFPLVLIPISFTFVMLATILIELFST